MAYPNLPNNRLIVNGVDLTATYGLILADGYSLEPPAPKIYTVDIPGGNGVLDLTEALNGDVVYENRSQSFTFYRIYTDKFENDKTTISNFLHGRSFDYQMTMDPGYTYHGRFTVSQYDHAAYVDGILGAIVVNIDADPYKKKDNPTQYYNISNGIVAKPTSGRKTVQPKFEFSDNTIVIFEDNRWVIPSGTYTLNNVWFKQGVNEIFFMPADKQLYVTYGEMSNHTYATIRTLKPIYQWYFSASKYYVSNLILKPSDDDTPIEAGTVEITATDESGTTVAASIDLGDYGLYEVGNKYDYIKIDGTTAKVVRWFEEGSLEELPTPNVYVHTVDELCSFDSNVTVTHNTTGTLTYEIKSTVRDYSRLATFGDYSEGGEFEMTHAEMSAYRYSQLVIFDAENNRVSDYDTTASVYLDYEWGDL